MALLDALVYEVERWGHNFVSSWWLYVILEYSNAFESFDIFLSNRTDVPSSFDAKHLQDQQTVSGES